MSDAAVDVFADAFEEDPIVVTAEQARFARAWDRAVVALPKYELLQVRDVPGLLEKFNQDRYDARIEWWAGDDRNIESAYGDSPAAALEALADVLEKATP